MQEEEVNTKEEEIVPIIGPEAVFKGGNMYDLHPDNIEGGGIRKIAKSTINLFNPAEWKRKHKAINENLKKTQPLTSEEKEKAYLSAQAYKHKNKRENVGKHIYIPHESTNDYAIYHNPELKRRTLVFKGTSSLKDIRPDIHIATGTHHLSKPFIKSIELLDQLKKKYPDEDWETAGHSLGATLAMYAAQKHGVQSHAFNPGFVDFADDKIDTTYNKHNIYLTKGDPISNSILSRNIKAPIKVQERASKWNPIKNHTIQSFLDNSPNPEPTMISNGLSSMS